MVIAFILILVSTLTTSDLQVTVPAASGSEESLYI